MKKTKKKKISTFSIILILILITSTTIVFLSIPVLFNYKSLERTGTREVVPIDEKKLLNLTFTCFKDPKTGVWYGIPIGENDETGRPVFRRVTIAGRRMYYIENEEDAIEWALVKRHPSVLNSPLQKGKPILKIYDRKKEATVRLSKIRRGAEAVDIALNKLAGNELFDFARTIGVSPENNDLEVVAQLVAEKAQREGNYQHSAKIQYSEIPTIEKTLNRLHKSIEHNRYLKLEVTTEDIADIVSKWTGIPLTKLISGEKEKLLLLEKQLQKRIVGQNEAVSRVSDTIRMSKLGITDQTRPLGSFLFLGSTGIGKTELAKSLAEILFDDEKALVRLDMSEYMEPHSISKLIGSPPGYIGYE